jgi:hypothetical protein
VKQSHSQADYFSRDFLWFCDAMARGSSTLLLRGALEREPSFGLGQCNQPLQAPSSQPTSKLCCAHSPPPSSTLIAITHAKEQPN